MNKVNRDLESKKLVRKNISLYEQDIERLDQIMKRYNIDASEVIRQLINNQYIYEVDKNIKYKYCTRFDYSIDKIESNVEIRNEIFDKGKCDLDCNMCAYVGFKSPYTDEPLLSFYQSDLKENKEGKKIE